ncbi:MAG: hypothetical protein ACM3U2_15880, partial [Deltaproteobacteria bacterium]
MPHTTISPINKRSRIAAVCLALAVFSRGGAASAEPAAAQLREQRQREIAGKSESERARLQRN